MLDGRVGSALIATTDDEEARMEPTSKLRVVTTDTPDALRVVREEVEEATGLAAEPEIQEVDGGELVVELRLAGPTPVVPGLVARAVGRSRRGLDVLSSWNEARGVVDPAPASGQVILDGLADHLPAVVRRALRDDIPTAQWQGTSTGIRTPGEGSPAWQLAVPVVKADGRPLVAYQQRRGYSFRFGTHDVVAARVELAS
jgi:hypothetical protein